jgi:hypothetical protein
MNHHITAALAEARVADLHEAASRRLRRLPPTGERVRRDK